MPDEIDMSEEKEDKVKKEKKVKIVFEEKFACPHCGERVILRSTRKLIEPAVPAEYEEAMLVEKDSQTTLETPD